MAININTEIMKAITQAEVNKACHSRSYAALDDALMRVKIELVVAEEDLALTEHPTRQQLFHIKVIKLNIERLENRIGDLVARNIKRAEKTKEQKEKLDMALAIIQDRAREKSAKELLSEAKNRVNREDIKSFKDPALVKMLDMWEAGETDFTEQAKILKEQEKLKIDYTVSDIKADDLVNNKTKSVLDIMREDKGPAVEELFKPDENGEVEL